MNPELGELAEEYASALESYLAERSRDRDGENDEEVSHGNSFIGIALPRDRIRLATRLSVSSTRVGLEDRHARRGTHGPCLDSAQPYVWRSLVTSRWRRSS